MTEELQFICVITLLFILGAMSIYLKPDKEDEQQTQKPSKNKTQKINEIDALNALLSQGIISQQEYNKMVVKVMNRK